MARPGLVRLFLGWVCARAVLHNGLTRQARWQLVGAGVGMIGFGLLGSVVGRPPVIVGGGSAMLGLGAYVAVRFREHGFTPVRDKHWRAAVAILGRGAGL